ncbi:hypothetical protein CR513_26750, partial [Mucuna pruriens]
MAVRTIVNKHICSIEFRNIGITKVKTFKARNHPKNMADGSFKERVDAKENFEGNLRWEGAMPMELDKATYVLQLSFIFQNIQDFNSPLHQENEKTCERQLAKMNPWAIKDQREVGGWPKRPLQHQRPIRGGQPK